MVLAATLVQLGCLVKLSLDHVVPCCIDTSLEAMETHQGRGRGEMRVDLESERGAGIEPISSLEGGTAQTRVERLFPVLFPVLLTLLFPVLDDVLYANSTVSKGSSQVS